MDTATLRTKMARLEECILRCTWKIDTTRDDTPADEEYRKQCYVRRAQAEVELAHDRAELARRNT